MPILNPFMVPSAGIPQPVVLKRKTSNMTQPDFYNQVQQQDPMAGLVTPEGSQQQQFSSDPVTGEYIQQQLQKMANRQAPPMLEPAARVISANTALVEPGNFQGFYERLNSINQMGDEQLQAAKAKSAFKRIQDLNNILSQNPPAFQGLQLQGSGGGSSGGQNFGSGVPSNPKANFAYAQQVAPQYGWGADELSAWYTLGMKESGWNNNAQNPTSTAYGIGQFLNSTWAGTGYAKTSDPGTQVQAMAKYIQQRYGSPSRALAFHISHNWY